MSSGPLAGNASAQTNHEKREQSFRERVQPLIAKYCADCHAGDKAEGGMSFDGAVTEVDIWNVMLQGKLLMGGERWQPYLMVGAGYGEATTTAPSSANTIKSTISRA